MRASLNILHKREEIALLADWTYSRYGAVDVVENDYIKLLAKNKVEQNKDARQWIQNLIKYFIIVDYEISDLDTPEASEPTIKKAKITEAIIKKEDATAVFNARTITDDEYENLKKETEKEWTPAEELEFKKAKIKKEMLKADNTYEPKNELFYKIFDDDRLRQYIWNYRPYNKDVDDKLSEGLKAVERQDKNRNEKNGTKEDRDGNKIQCGILEYSFNTINTERKFSKHKNLIQVISGLGIKNIWDFKTQISTEELRETIKKQEWLAKEEELVLYTTDTKKQKKIINHMSDHSSKTFLRETLYFINTAMRAEWGVSLTATNKHATYYEIRPNKTLDVMFKKEEELRKINGWPYLGE